MTPEDLLVERLIRRIEKANILFLKDIGNSIKAIRNLTPTEAEQLIQILKYGGNYETIINKIAEYSNLNIQDIDDIFMKYAGKDQRFYEKFYKYRGLPFIPAEENIALRAQIQAISNIVKTEMYNYARTNVLGYTIKDINGIPRFFGLRETYNKLLDTALLNVGQGKETFDTAMGKILNDVGTSGIKTLDYASGRSIRLDSAIRMHLKGRLRELHNENQKIFGKEFKSDGIEISVHLNPAPDHAEAQGRQFSNEEYEKLQAGQVATDYTGHKITLDHDGKNGYRPISEMNCYHYVFSIILGVSKAEYSPEELANINETNNKGFEFEGNHYTNYQGTQLQRNLELAIRKQKDVQILAKASDNKKLLDKSQKKITQLSQKYSELSKISGLPTKVNRMKVSGYRRMKV